VPFALLICFLSFVCRLAAQPPAIGQNGVVNQASQIAPALAGGALARGARIEIRGVRLVSQDGKAVVMMGEGGSYIPLAVLSASAKVIAARIPPDAPLGAATVSVNTSGGTSAPFAVEIAASNPGLYSRNGQGWGLGRLNNVDAEGKRSENSNGNAARPGQRVILGATGMGSATSIRVFVGGRSSLAAVRQTERPGEEELVFAIPRNAPAGCNVPTYVLAGPKRASNVVTVAIDPKGACEDRFISAHVPARLLLAVFSRTIMKSDQLAGESAPGESIYDEAVVSFAKVGLDARPSPLLLAPPPGTCISYSGSFQTSTMLPDSPTAALFSEVGATGLDAGPALTIARQSATRSIPGNPSASGFFRTRLGGRNVSFGPRALAPFLDPGEYRLTVPGGHDIGAFSAQFTGPSPLEWTNRDRIEAVDRTRELSLEWRGAATDRLVIVLATNVDQVSTATGTVVCTALASVGRLTIGPELLANLPASGPMSASKGGVPYNRLFLGTVPAKPQPINASGLDGGAIIGLYTTGRFVDYR
jgi:uncharacterized protein (TIGR03437 family)